MTRIAVQGHCTLFHFSLHDFLVFRPPLTGLERPGQAEIKVQTEGRKFKPLPAFACWVITSSIRTLTSARLHNTGTPVGVWDAEVSWALDLPLGDDREDLRGGIDYLV
ncbi:hypothetical protein PAXRUDRAFT_459974, partial [Paxillus rubicundulus Ve08.2h10]